MKLIIIFILSIFNLNYTQENFRLNGKYKSIPNRGETYFIEFNESIYMKTSSKGISNNGIIQYGKGLIYLKDYQKKLKIVNGQITEVETNKLKEMDLIALQVGKSDSIKYSHHAYKDGGVISWLHVSDESGILVKVK